MFCIVIPNTVIIKKENIRKGAKGIWLFILALDRAIRNSPTIAPNQKEKKKSVIEEAIPKINPIPRASFTSPKPIALPLEKYQIRKKGNAKSGPAIKAGKNKKLKLVTDLKHKDKKAKPIKGYTILSGMILCLIS